MKFRILTSLCITACLGSPAYAQQSGPLANARDLYASARYDEALAVLNGLPMGGESTDRKSIQQYRSLCLLALGRGSEAESAIAAVVTVDPLFVPAESDASPRVRAAFSEVRQRLLPEIAAGAVCLRQGGLRPEGLRRRRTRVPRTARPAERSADEQPAAGSARARDRFP